MPATTVTTKIVVSTWNVNGAGSISDLMQSVIKGKLKPIKLSDGQLDRSNERTICCLQEVKHSTLVDIAGGCGGYIKKNLFHITGYNREKKMIFYATQVVGIKKIDGGYQPVGHDNYNVVLWNVNHFKYLGVIIPNYYKYALTALGYRSSPFIKLKSKDGVICACSVHGNNMASDIGKIKNAALLSLLFEQKIGYPTILAGDFNRLPDKFKPELGDAMDGWERNGLIKGHVTHVNSDNGFTACLDYIFVRNDQVKKGNFLRTFTRGINQRTREMVNRKGQDEEHDHASVHSIICLGQKKSD